MADKFRYLHSVGCYFNVDTLEVSAYSPYDPLAEGMGTNVADCDDEWWSRLSEVDMDTVANATNEYYGGGLPDDAYEKYVANLNWN